MRTAAARNARQEAENMKARYDRKYDAKYKGFRPGDLVWLLQSKPKVSSQYKIAPRKRGPYTIVTNPLPGFWLVRFHNQIIKQLYPGDRLTFNVKDTECRLRTPAGGTQDTAGM